MLVPRPLKFAVISGVVALFGVIFGWVLFPVILKSQLKKEMALSRKTDVRTMWEKIPFPMDFKVYMFNYTNPEEIMKGAVPIVQEIGPYHFELFKEKVEVVDNDEDDTVSYKMLDTFYFNRDLSGPKLTGEEIITMPHIVMMGIALSIGKEKPNIVNLITKAINGIFENPTDLFLRAKVLDVLFRGIMINCARTEFGPKTVCSQLKKESAAGLIVEPNSQIRFSIFGARNGTIDKRVITVKRGIKDVLEVGTLVAIDGKTEQKAWRDACKEFVGTDNTVFPPFMTPKKRVLSFIFGLCRPFRPWYQKKTKYAHINTYRYITEIGDLANDPELQCFCDTPDTCPPKGVMDMNKCIDAPMHISLPHFFDADPQLLKYVKGLNPEFEQHGMMFDFEPISGTPLVVKQRVQFNMELWKHEKLPLFKDMPGTLAPIFWVEEGYYMNKTFTNLLRNQLILPKRVVNVVRWWLLSFGFIGAVLCVLYHFRDKIKPMAQSRDSKTAKVKPEGDEEPQKDISVIGQAQGPAKVM